MIEPAILSCWLLLILIYQFHDLTARAIKKMNYLGLIPNFHLFSPQPFLGRYIIKYVIINSNKINDEGENQVINYISKNDFLDSNKKLIKCINNLCRTLPLKGTNNNLKLLLNFVRNEIKDHHYEGKFEFSVWIKYTTTEKLKYKSKVYDL